MSPILASLKPKTYLTATVGALLAIIEVMATTG